MPPARMNFFFMRAGGVLLCLAYGTGAAQSHFLRGFFYKSSFNHAAAINLNIPMYRSHKRTWNAEAHCLPII